MSKEVKDKSLETDKSNVKKSFSERLAEVCDETGAELNAKDISEKDFQEIVDLAVSLSSDGKLSSEDTEAIMEAVKSKEGILTHRHAEKLLDAVRESTTSNYTKKIPTAMRVIGGVAWAVGLVGVIKAVYSLLTSGQDLLAGQFQNFGTVELIFTLITALLTVAVVVLSILLGARLMRGNRSRAAVFSYALVGVTIVLLFFETLLTGISTDCCILVVMLILEVILTGYLHPSLAQERELEHALLKEETKKRHESGTLGKELNQKDGYIKLDFFNIFWIFVIASFLGLIVEIIWHMVVVDPGVYQSREGLLYGPFSPIYGVGCVLMTLALNRFKHKNIIIIFIVCTIIGGAFEYFVSWWMESAFGIIAWDYHGKFLGDLFDGRTCLAFASMFGALGTVWIKLLLPITLRIINMIPWKWRYSITGVCALLMLVNCLMTVQALDCWYMRVAGQPVETPVQQFYAEHYNNDFMANRFQSMNIDPSRTACRN